MGRREAREAAMKLLHSIDYHRDDFQYQIESFMEDEDAADFGDKDKNYINEITGGVAEKITEIDSIIGKYSKNWTLNRMPGIDIAVLRLSIYEMFYREDIPANVSINEAVDLAKRYGHDESGTFINGILGGIYRDAVKAGTIKEETERRNPSSGRKNNGNK